MELGGTKLSANDFNSMTYFYVIWALTGAQVVTFVIAYGLMVCTKKSENLKMNPLDPLARNSGHCFVGIHFEIFCLSQKLETERKPAAAVPPWFHDNQSLPFTYTYTHTHS